MENKNTLPQVLNEMENAIKMVDLDVISNAVELLLNAYKAGSTIYCIGNGGSASTAAHFAADLGKFATGNKVGFRALDLVSNYSAHTAWTNDNSWDNTWVGMLKPWIKKEDILVLFSVNGGTGWSNNLVNAIKLAHNCGAKTIGFAGNGGGAFAELCTVPIIVSTPKTEFITPVTESVHVCLHHMIVTEIRNKLSN